MSTQLPKSRLQEFAAALRKHHYRAKLLLYGSMLVAGITQIIIRERFPELHPPWPIIGAALIVVLFAVLLVPPSLLVLRLRKSPKSENHEPHS